VSTSTEPLRHAPAGAVKKGGLSALSAVADPPKRTRSYVATAMTIDVEDYFQVEAFASTIDRKDWELLPTRVARNTERLLAILAEANTEATFFVLGWIAQRNPALVKRIAAAGHELASHGFDHVRFNSQSREAFRADVRRSKCVLEDLGGVPVIGYRAPTFSISRDSSWAHAILREEGYEYSSSVYPRKHDLYGTPGAPRTVFAPVPGLLEVPLTAVRVLGIDVPASGGGFFRLFPYNLTRRLMAYANRTNRAPAIFYIHPWEIDPEQPRHQQAPFLSRFRHYLNLSRTEARLRQLLSDFVWGRMDRIFLDQASAPVPVIASWTDRKSRLR
jgi:polysaccharide deacetylase family protein (PEP-CTERM system associated)